MKNIVAIYYQGTAIAFREDGWFNATAAAFKYGKRPVDWLKLDSTNEYIAGLMRHMQISEKSSLILARRNSGTWLHPRLAVPFGRWLDVDFAIWCDIQVDTLVRGTHPHYDWKRARSEAASSFKVMNAVLQLRRQDRGKETAAHHFSNEARMVNWALTGEFKGLDRDALSDNALTMLAQLEERNAVLIGCGLDYAERKLALQRFVGEAHPRIAA